MKITIPTASIIATWSGTASVFTEAWTTIDGWLKQGKIVPQNPGISGDDSLFESGITQFVPTQAELLTIGKGDVLDANGIIFDNPMVWEADLAIWDLTMITTVTPFYLPTNGNATFPETSKFTAAGTATKTVGEWVDSLCEIWKNTVTGKVHIYTNPINNVFLEYHFVRMFKNEYTVANHISLTNDTLIKTTAGADSDHVDVNWVKQQP